MLLNEIVKSFLNNKKNTRGADSSIVHPHKVSVDLTNNDLYSKFNDFFDGANDNEKSSLQALLNGFSKETLLEKQRRKILEYRNSASNPDVNNAIDAIVNEIIFSYEDVIFKLQYNEENAQLQEAFQKAFDKIYTLGNFNKTFYEVVKKTYIDGQIVFHLTYDKKNLKNGIQKIKLLDPVGLFYDHEKDVWRYENLVDDNLYMTMWDRKQEYHPEEIVRVDFGLYDNNICLSYLEYGIKIANILRTLEDLLVPMRFSRSISRRVFNVDIGDLPAKRGEEYLNHLRERFKYKKSYDTQTGEISNQQHVVSMVEDYWFANRSGSRGTTVELLDERGELGNLDDIIYFNKKLYRALNVPSSKMDIDPDANHAFTYDATESTQEDVKFMMFISRVRKVYSKAIKEILKREVISTKIMNEREWDMKDCNINIEFTNDNLFIEKMKLDVFASRVEAFGQINESMVGKIYPVTDVLKRIFGLNEQEVLDNIKKIALERHDPFLKTLYPPLEEGEEEIDVSDLEKTNLNDLFDMGGIQGSEEDSEGSEDSEDTEGTEGSEDTESGNDSEEPSSRRRGSKDDEESGSENGEEGEGSGEETGDEGSEENSDPLGLGDFDISGLDTEM